MAEDRARRYQVVREDGEGKQVLVDSFDLLQRAQLCADRIIRNYDHRPKELQIPRPAVHVVDTLGNTEENA